MILFLRLVDLMVPCVFNMINLMLLIQFIQFFGYQQDC